MDEPKSKQAEYSRRYREKDPEAYRARNAAYAREWRARPENLERARASNRASQARARAADPEAWLQRSRERYRKYVSNPANVERKRAKERQRRANGEARRRGLSKADLHDYWVNRGGTCDFCGQPCPDPAEKGAWRFTVFDHDKDHCASSIGCRHCVRAMAHRPCNVAEGYIRRAMEIGMIDGFTGRLADAMADWPLQRWLHSRSVSANT